MLTGARRRKAPARLPPTLRRRCSCLAFAAASAVGERGMPRLIGGSGTRCKKQRHAHGRRAGAPPVRSLPAQEDAARARDTHPIGTGPPAAARRERLPASFLLCGPGGVVTPNCVSPRCTRPTNPVVSQLGEVSSASGDCCRAGTAARWRPTSWPRTCRQTLGRPWTASGGMLARAARCVGGRGLRNCMCVYIVCVHVCANVCVCMCVCACVFACVCARRVFCGVRDGGLPACAVGARDPRRPPSWWLTCRSAPICAPALFRCTRRAPRSPCARPAPHRRSVQGAGARGEAARAAMRGVAREALQPGPRGPPAAARLPGGGRRESARICAWGGRRGAGRPAGGQLAASRHVRAGLRRGPDRRQQHLHHRGRSGERALSTRRQTGRQAGAALVCWCARA